MARLSWRGIVVALGCAALPAVPGGGCSGGDDPPPLDPASSDGTGGDAGAAGSGANIGGNGGAAGNPVNGGGPGSGGSAGSAGSSGAAGAAGAPANCGQLVCRGHGRCIINPETLMPQCICDEGYVHPADDETQCVVDESCIKLRFLEEGCRQADELGPPAVGLFFAVDYCAGTAVLPEQLGELSGAFVVMEDGDDIQHNPESYATVVPRGVESFVTVAVDVSGSIAQAPNLLSQLIEELRSFVQGLAAAPQEAPVSVSLLLFGRNVVEHVPFTTELDEVDSALQTLEADLGAGSIALNQNGTALYEVTRTGILHTERIQRLRDQVTRGGVLSTGTLVVVTDGNDESGETLDTALIDSTLVNLVSIGISSDINDDDLTRIGRDGSFLAPTPVDWAEAFDEIKQRVDQYPDRAYLLAYCSAATTGTHTVTVSLNAITPQQDATCTFDANLFSSSPEAVCDAEYLQTACDGVQCGGLLACGTCGPDQCCALGQCQLPAPNPDCRAQNELCSPTADRCVATDDGAYVCEPPLALDEACVGGDCEAGAAYCSEGFCTAVTLAEGDYCDPSGTPVAELCPGLNCARRNPDNQFDRPICQRPARMYELCSGEAADAICETGTTCTNSICQPRTRLLCDSDSDCLTGECVSGRCVDTGYCHFSWEEKLGG